MAFGTLAVIHDSATHPAKAFRNATAAGLGLPMTTHANAVAATTRGGGHGVVGDGDMLVTTTTGLGYSVAAGRAYVVGSFAIAQGTYNVYNDAAVTGTLAARDATNPRISLICVRVRDTDTDATGAEDVGIIEVVGTPAATPAVPSIASSLGSLLVLSQVTVPSSANGGAPTFSDVRPFATGLGGIIRCKATTRPTAAALYTGLRIYETDTGFEYMWTGGSWRLMSPTSWTAQSNFSMSTASVPTDATFNFGAAPFTGIGQVTCSYNMISTTNGSISTQIYTNSYPDPTGGGGWIGDRGFVSVLGGSWNPGSVLSISVPITAGGGPSVIFRLATISSGTISIRGTATIIGAPTATAWVNP
jgi:hypothetical protein